MPVMAERDRAIARDTGKESFQEDNRGQHLAARSPNWATRTIGDQTPPPRTSDHSREGGWFQGDQGRQSKVGGGCGVVMRNDDGEGWKSIASSHRWVNL